MADMLEAILFLSALTFIIALGHTGIQAYAFYRRYRIRLQISSKSPSLHARELLSMAPDTIPLIADPEPLAHSRQDTVLGSQRWPDFTDQRRSSYTRPVPRSMGTSMNASINPNLNLNLNRNLNPVQYQSDQGPASVNRPFTNFGATVHDYPVNNLDNNHPFERLATPDTVSHTTKPRHVTQG